MDGVEALAREAVEMPVLAGMLGIGPLPHIGAGGEHLPRSGQDRDADVVAVGERIEGGDQLLAEFRVLGVDRGPVHHHGGDVILHGELHGSCHPGVPRLVFLLTASYATGSIPSREAPARTLRLGASARHPSGGSCRVPRGYVSGDGLTGYPGATPRWALKRGATGRISAGRPGAASRRGRSTGRRTGTFNQAR